MQDYSAAALLRLIALGLERQGISGGPERARGGHRIDLGAKRRLLSDLRQRHGMLAILRIGEVVPEAAADPMLSVMFAATGVRDLIGRWLRLERYVHSRHRIELAEEGPRRIRLRHFNAKGGEPPTAEEDALVFGMLVGLMSGIGVEALAVGVPGEEEPAFDSEWKRAPASADLSEWWFSWDAAPARAPEPPLEHVTASARITAAIEADPLRAWSVDDAAALLHLSSRSLQRRLQEEAASLREVVRGARGRVAASQLVEGENPLAVVGFQAGFSDQAHFTREFKRLTGMTPAQYRENFRRRSA